jgi:hypothetical protein
MELSNKSIDFSGLTQDEVLGQEGLIKRVGFTENP